MSGIQLIARENCAVSILCFRQPGRTEFRPNKIRAAYLFHIYKSNGSFYQNMSDITTCEMYTSDVKTNVQKSNYLYLLLTLKDFR